MSSSLRRSHSQTDSRTGWPNCDRNSSFVPDGSSTCVARKPSGRPANLFFVPVAARSVSSICSAVNRRGLPRAKFTLSSALLAVGSMLS